ncbi:MAG: hypothetical protein COB20_00710 [SAR86 cluster bacterium]|uniref:Uncharacterized protein n=1 Tax=SAR86 cluster bacterium TaxID=2030880 RepID=A0A2A4XJ50_9GAMM|nr:MAG: hypothetical protein COB20_00710 [SAR86 cluster bacterium]
MNKMKARAQAQFPTVLLTLISIIQALALELMWSKIVESEWLWNFDLQALIGWGMILVVFLGILQVWVMYSAMVMGFIWQPYLRDSIIPFIIGIQEFMLVTLIGEEFNTLWLYVLGSIFITGNWVSHSSFRRARQEPENDEFFGKMKPATLRDFWPVMSIVTVLIVFGIAIDVAQSQTWLPLVALIIANIILVFQIFMSRRLWRSIMGMNETSEDEEESA